MFVCLFVRLSAKTSPSVAYTGQQDEPLHSWRSANIEGPVYLVRRRSGPRYQLLLKSQVGTGVDILRKERVVWTDNNWVVYYGGEDGSKCLRGLWFDNDNEREKFVQELQNALVELEVFEETEIRLAGAKKRNEEAKLEGFQKLF